MPRTNRDIIEEVCDGNVVAGDFLYQDPNAGLTVVAKWRDGDVLLTDAGRALVETIRASEQDAALADAAKSA